MSSYQSTPPAATSSKEHKPTPVPSIDDSLGLKLLPFTLSLTAGSLDIMGLLALGGLFTAHITGNLVILAARLVAQQPTTLSHAIAVPVFVAMLALTRLFVAALDRIGLPSLLPLLVLEFLFLLVTLAVCLAAGPRADPNEPEMVLAGMLAVCGMSVQNALVRVSLTDSPSTTVMTTNITVFVMDLGEICFGRTESSRANARVRARRAWPAIAGFIFGCGLGAFCESMFGRAALALPTLLSVIAIAFALTGRDRGTRVANPASRS